MGVNEFIEQYTYSEVEKIKRKDVLSRFSNKLNLQNVANQVAHDANESSPIRGKRKADFSPLRQPIYPFAGGRPKSSLDRTWESALNATNRSTSKSPSISRVLASSARRNQPNNEMQLKTAR